MAERRMFAKTIVLSDSFLDMPMSARCLYFTLGMLADDDGFVNSPRSIMRQCGASEDDMKMLITKKFVLIFDSGVIVIKHWRINNYLRNDRYKKTSYTGELESLIVEENGTYHLGVPNSGIPGGIPNNGIPSIGKDSIGKDSIGYVGADKPPDTPPKAKRFVPPTLEEVRAFIEEQNLSVDPDRFFAYYSAGGWMVGKRAMKDWKAAVRYWERREPEKAKDANAGIESHNWDYDELEKLAAKKGLGL